MKDKDFINDLDTSKCLLRSVEDYVAFMFKGADGLM